MSQNIYQITNLEHYYNKTPALKINRFSISPASIIGLIGPNGSGKTTFLKLLAFVEKPTKGKIFFKGKAAEPFADYVRFQVTLLTQEPYLMKRSVFDNISYSHCQSWLAITNVVLNSLRALMVASLIS